MLLEAFKDRRSRRWIDFATGVREQGHKKVGAAGYQALAPSIQQTVATPVSLPAPQQQTPAPAQTPQPEKPDPVPEMIAQAEKALAGRPGGL